MRIPPEKIDEIRDATNIIDMISPYVRLKKRGKNYVGLCPFHSEKTPSFTVSAERQLYHCFGCGAGGNIFTFFMQQEKISFAEAVRFLADRVGISLARWNQFGGADEAAATEQEGLYQAMRTAGLFYYDTMVGTTEGELALAYFHNRGFKDETIRKFGLGYSPSSWNALVKHAEASGISIEHLEKSGLVRPREDGSYHDYFHGRLMFPIFSASGRVIAFGARKFHEDDPLGKYINSPETPVYSKSHVLYGLFQAKEAIRKEESAILVEGYADLISVFQAGVQNVTASGGTSLTEGQVRLLSRYAKTVTLVYDADSAGSRAALRGVDVILENNLEVRVAQLPAGADPDSYVQKNGGEAFRKLVETGESFIDFKARTYQSEGKFATPEGRAEAVRSIVQSIAKIPDELKRNFYIKSVADKYDVYETVLFRELERSTRSLDRAMRREETVQKLPVIDKPLFDAPLRAEIPAAERDLLKLILEHGGEMIQFISEHTTVDEFSDQRVRSFIHRIFEQYERDRRFDASMFINGLDDDAATGFVTNVILTEYETRVNWEAVGVSVHVMDDWQIAAAALVVLKREEINRRLEDNKKALKEASQQKRHEGAYLETHQRLIRERDSLEIGRFLKEANTEKRSAQSVSSPDDT